MSLPPCDTLIYKKWTCGFQPQFLAHRSHSSWNFLCCWEGKDVFCHVNEETQGTIYRIRGLASGPGAAGRMCHQCGEACFNPPQGEACGVEPLGRGTLPMGRLVLSGGWEDWGPGGWWAGQMMEEADPSD